MTADVPGWRAGQHGQHTAWPDTRTAALVAAWAAGASRVDLRARFGLTPGQLAGKLDRLKAAGRLPERGRPAEHASPVAGGRWAGQRPLPLAQQEIPPAVLPLPTAQQAAPPAAPQRPLAQQAAPPAAPQRPLAAEPPPRPAASPPPRYGRVTECCWPLGDPRTREFRFCGDPSEPGTPYCPGHLKRARVPRSVAPPTAGLSA